MKGGGVFTMLVWGMLVPIAIVFVIAGDPAGWVMAAIALPLMFPWYAARFVCVPLGAVRAAYVLGRVAEVVFARDRAGGALLAAAWAALRRRDTRGVVWVERRLARVRAAGGASVVASGLLAAAGGDDAGARLVLSSIALLDEDDVPAAARGVAADWLAADAAERGDWAAVRAPLAITATTRFLATAACRLLGEAIADRALRRAWWLVPRHRATRPLLERALAARPVSAPAAPAAAASPGSPAAPYRDALDDTLLAGALAAHARVVAAAAPTAAQLGEVARAWDEALGATATRVVVEERARVLGARAADALAALATGAAQDLADVAWRAGIGLDVEGGVGATATTRLRERALVDVEAAARSLGARVAAGRLLPATGEWRDVLALREQVARAGRVAGLAARRLVFEDVHAAVCPLACKLWNDREQRVLSAAMFRWLLSEAIAVGNARLAEHERRNVAAG